MKIFNPQPGTEFHNAAKTALSYAKRNKIKVLLKFNEHRVGVSQFDTADRVWKRYLRMGTAARKVQTPVNFPHIFLNNRGKQNFIEMWCGQKKFSFGIIGGARRANTVARELNNLCNMCAAWATARK